MAEVVIELPVKLGAEASLFGAYLSQYMRNCSREAVAWATDHDTPYLMVRSDPLMDVEVKVLTFQRRSAATAFSNGWTEAKAQAGWRGAA
jgi:hypothetical protein